MKKIIFILASFIMLTSQAQEKRKSIAVSYGFGSGSTGSFKKLDGGGSNESKSLHKIGLLYLNELSKNLYFETGISYIDFKYTSIGPFYGGQIPRVISNHQVKLINIPLKLKYEAGKYVFFNGGVFTDIAVSRYAKYKEKEYSGLGTNLGMGLQYPISKKLSLYTNPQLDLRNIISFSSENHPYFIADAIVDFGIKLRLN